MWIQEKNKIYMIVNMLDCRQGFISISRPRGWKHIWLQFHPLIHNLYSLSYLEFWEGWCLSLTVIEGVAEYTLDKLPVHHRPTKYALVDTYTSKDDLQTLNNQTFMFLDYEREPRLPWWNPCLHRKSMQTPWLQKDSRPRFEPGTLLLPVNSAIKCDSR